MDDKLKKGIVIVLFANLINVLFNFGTSVILPKYLSVDSYAEIKSFHLYISYIGLLHLGFIDGMYLLYGGKKIEKKVDTRLLTDKSTMMIFQIVLSLVLIIGTLFTCNFVVIAFALSILPVNMLNYFKLLYQATGEFKLYGRIMNSTTILTFIINVFLLFVIKTDAYIYYLVGYLFLYFFVWILLEIIFRKNHTFEKHSLFSSSIFVSNIKNGFLLTLGNLSSILLTSIDSWFVKFLMTSYWFAQYSFAVTVETFLNNAITPVTTTLYNYFCREKDENKHRDIFRYILIFATLLPASGYLVKFLIEIFLQKYTDSITVVFLLFGAQFFYIIIKSIFINLYKAQKRQKTYFWKLCVVIIIGFFLNVILYFIIGTMESFAIGTFLNSIIWFLICSKDFSYLHIRISEVIYVLLSAVCFILLGVCFYSLIGLLIYIVIQLLLMYLFFKKYLIGIKKYISRYINKLKAKKIA